MNPATTLIATWLFLLAAASLSAGSIERAIVAAMYIAETPNYSWVCSVTDDARTYEIEGKVRSDGYTWQRQPMPKTVARRLGRDAEHELEAIFRGPLDYVIRTPGGWKMLHELPKRHDEWNDESEWYYVTSSIMRTPDMPADEGQFPSFGLPAAICIPVLRESDPDRAYSNAQFALARPHDELAIIVSSHDELHVEGDAATGSLTDLGARLLLVHDGHEYITPVLADGRFKLWIADGIVTKYTVELAGIVVVEDKPIYVRQKSTTLVKDVGTTQFEVPPAARERLGS